jgi:hypothetical protein
MAVHAILHEGCASDDAPLAFSAAAMEAARWYRVLTVDGRQQSEREAAVTAVQPWQRAAAGDPRALRTGIDIAAHPPVGARMHTFGTY